MKRFFGMFVGLGIFTTSAIVNATNVSGTINTNTVWNTGGSPYIVTDNLTVNNGITLTIQPGVEVKLDSMKRIIIKGTLNAVGTISDSIIFTKNSPDTSRGWGRLLFEIASTGSLKYCRIEYAKESAIVDSLATYLEIEYNTISNNFSESYGGGILSFSSSAINRNTITNNIAAFGGGIMCFGEPTISNNMISNNIAWIAGGICVTVGAPTISGNTIAGNMAEEMGGGIAGGGAPIIINNKIFNNTGFGISNGESFFIRNNLIYNNAGGSIYSECGGAIIRHNTIIDTTEYAIYTSYGSIKIDSNNIYTTGYAVYNDDSFYIDASYNYWGTTDTNTINMKIFDFYDNPTKGIVCYKPFMTDSFGVEEKQLPVVSGEWSVNIKTRKDKIYLEVGKSVNADVKIYDLCGRLKEAVYSGTLGKGKYEFTANVRKSGVYFVRVSAGNYKETKKLILMK